MLSDEMTTGSVTTTDADKRAYAARSHTWNLGQRKFKEVFPDVSGVISIWSSNFAPPATLGHTVAADAIHDDTCINICDFLARGQLSVGGGVPGYVSSSGLIDICFAVLHSFAT